MVIGPPADWADLIDPMVPVILKLVLTSWAGIQTPASDEMEDAITETLCRKLRQDRTARDLPFQIHTQLVELEPANGERLGRLDIAFIPLVNREDIYFCLECKRLNVINDGVKRSYASEYVAFGMLRFVTGQYSHAVRHGAMIGYVLDGDVTSAMTNVETSIHRRHVELRMHSPGALLQSSVLKTESRARETHHNRTGENSPSFCIHHLFVAA